MFGLPARAFGVCIGGSEPQASCAEPILAANNIPINCLRVVFVLIPSLG